MRISADELWLSVAYKVAQRGTCARRKVGCVIVDTHGRIMSTGYNGVAAGEPHCIETPCAGANAPSGTNLGACEAIHAEENAIDQCKDTKLIGTIYSTSAPCFERCLRKLLNTSATRIVFSEDYPGSEISRDRWLSRGREWLHIPMLPDGTVVTLEEQKHYSYNHRGCSECLNPKI